MDIHTYSNLLSCPFINPLSYAHHLQPPTLTRANLQIFEVRDDLKLPILHHMIWFFLSSLIAALDPS